MAKILTESKKCLLAELGTRVEDKILEPSNAALLSKLITNAENDDEALAIAALGTTYKRTGFHFDKRMEEPRMSNTIKYFKKNNELSFGKATEGGPLHKLIIGENYDALQNLLIQYRNEIDVIYIDPPYGKDNLGNFAKTNYKNSISRDNLLSMLYFRLQLAKQLLTEDGIIFCSIDDKNQAYVKCIFDEVFGEDNFIATICRETIKGGTKTKNIKQVHDYVIVHAKCLKSGGKAKSLLLGDEFEERLNFSYHDEKGEYAKGRELNKWGAGSRREDSPSMWYPIKGPNNEDVYPIRNDGSEGRWRWGKKKLTKAVDDGDVLFEKREDGTYIAFEKVRKNKTKNVQLVSFLKDKYLNSDGSEDLKEIFNTLMAPFDYAKPTSLIQELLSYIPTDDFKVLDFFAGSGTTGQAVLELNKDGGNRTFVLCQINEITDTTPNGIAYDVTSKRLKRIMTGECYDGSKNFKWAEENEPYGGRLDVYEIADVSSACATQGKTPFDVIDETLYGKEKFKTAREKIEWVCSNFSQTQMTVNYED